ncbi:MAG: CBS domain-containing protein [Rhodospirillales bacterium]|nr:CBS domain-containing protein [Rhodospirillales bacterium]
MVPLEEYTRVPDTASLYDAAKALEKAMVGPLADPSRPRDRAVLVQASDGRVVGKLSQWYILRGLEPRYSRSFDPLVMVDEYFSWTHPMFANLAEKSHTISVRDLLRDHTSAETIEEDAPLDQAAHQMVHGNFLSLLVMRDKNIVGILRLSDVFKTITAMLDPVKAQPISA